MPKDENIFIELASYKFAIDELINRFIEEEIEIESDFEIDNIKISQVAMDKDFSEEAYEKSSANLRNAIVVAIIDDKYQFNNEIENKLSDAIEIGKKFKNIIKEKIYSEEFKEIGFIINNEDLDVNSESLPYDKLFKELDGYYDNKIVEDKKSLILGNKSQTNFEDLREEKKDVTEDPKQTEEKNEPVGSIKKIQGNSDVHSLFAKKVDLTYLFYIVSYEYGESNGKNEEQLYQLRKELLDLNKELVSYYDAKNITITSNMLLNPTEMLISSNKYIYENSLKMIADRRDDLEKQYLVNLNNTTNKVKNDPVAKDPIVDNGEPQEKVPEENPTITEPKSVLDPVAEKSEPLNESRDIYSHSNKQVDLTPTKESSDLNENVELFVNVTYYDEKGNKIKTEKVPKGSTIEGLELEDKTFKNFSGWLIDIGDDELDYFDFSKPIESDIELLAEYTYNKKRIATVALGFTTAVVLSNVISPYAGLAVGGSALAGVGIVNKVKKLDPQQECNATGIKKAGYKLKHLMEDKTENLKNNLEIENSLNNNVVEGRTSR